MLFCLASLGHDLRQAYEWLIMTLAKTNLADEASLVRL